MTSKGFLADKSLLSLWILSFCWEVLIHKLMWFDLYLCSNSNTTYSTFLFSVNMFNWLLCFHCVFSFCFFCLLRDGNFSKDQCSFWDSHYESSLSVEPDFFWPLRVILPPVGLALNSTCLQFLDPPSRWHARMWTTIGGTHFKSLNSSPSHSTIIRSSDLSRINYAGGERAQTNGQEQPSETRGTRSLHRVQISTSWSQSGFLHEETEDTCLEQPTCRVPDNTSAGVERKLVLI